DAIAGPLVIGDGVGAAKTARLLQMASTQIKNTSSVTVKRDGWWIASSASEAIGALTMEGGAEINLGTGVLVLGGNVSVTAGSGAPAVISSQLQMGGVTRTVDVASAAE